MLPVPNLKKLLKINFRKINFRKHTYLLFFEFFLFIGLFDTVNIENWVWTRTLAAL